MYIWMYEAISIDEMELGTCNNASLSHVLRWVVNRKNVRDEDLITYIFSVTQYSFTFNIIMNLMFRILLLTIINLMLYFI